jgi:hypothetical protein
MPLKICYFQVGLIEQRNVCTAVCVTFSKVLAKSRGRESKGGWVCTSYFTLHDTHSQVTERHTRATKVMQLNFYSPEVTIYFTWFNIK